MKIFIDFEATEKGEIIAVGAKTADKEFYSLVKPQFSKLTPNIKRLTYISEEDLNKANVLDKVFKDLANWLDEQNSAAYTWEFYSYGNADIDFLKKSLRNCKSSTSYQLACQMIATMQDAFELTKDFFKQQVKLQQVYNYVKQQDNKQRHNALEDAKMLEYVMKYMKHNEPFEISPFIEVFSANKQQQQNFPKGKYIAQYPNCYVAKMTCSMEEMVRWLLSSQSFRNIPKDSQPKPTRIANRIINSIKDDTTYAGYKFIKVEDK